MVIPVIREGCDVYSGYTCSYTVVFGVRGVYSACLTPSERVW